VSQRRLPQLLSDHFLFMFDCGVGSRGRKYFKFKNVAAIRGFFRAGQNVVAVLQIMRVLLVLCWDRN
jgi:hypothetical protein